MRMKECIKIKPEFLVKHEFLVKRKIMEMEIEMVSQENLNILYLMLQNKFVYMKKCSAKKMKLIQIDTN